MHRTRRVPLGSRNVNVENNNAKKSSKAGGGGSSAPAPSEPTKKGSLLRQHSTTSGSTTSTASLSSATTAATSEQNKAFSSLSSDALRRAISSTSSQNSGGDASSTAADAGPGAASRPLKTGLRNAATASAGSSSKDKNAEPITIIEHRKRPCGDGFTVHKYIRGKMLGKGGFAKVYKVTSCDTNKEYAVKIVPKANLVKSRARQKLQTEIKIHRTMKHSNICEYKHFFEDKTNCYILLELCSNHSLNEMIKRRKTLTEEETRLLMAQLLEALTFMHDCNVIHRDLKLGNLFLSKSMNIKVGDFGLACRVDSSDEKRKTICGTPNYIAPEVIQGDKDKRGHSFEVDVWSMGVICFTMLVGKPPYESKDVKSTYRRILANEYSFPAGKVGEDAKTLISSMLQTDARMRPSLDEIRKHPFFTMHKVPRSIPSSCTTSAPIWSTDEFGELQVIKPTSALDINLRGRPAVNKVKKPTKPISVYDDEVNDQVECQLGSKPSIVEQISAKMSRCAIDDEVRDPPPPSTTPQAVSTPKIETLFSPAVREETKPCSPTSSNDDLRELEQMHDRLVECLTNYERIQNGGAKVPCPLEGGEVWGANKWITRYVDYTSKYGLGFLLNDGSSGVYFNDSTKAVHSATNDEFIYIERRKAGADGQIKEPVAIYTVNDYPQDALKKKVTLLQHFRNYLVEQQKQAEKKGESPPLSPSNFDVRQDGDNDDENGVPMVFMKKWIKTKHAMLFRLSNGTVQVLFYDSTEVLISSEGRLITYVDKDKNRFILSVAEIANKQNSDCQRRLKYSKEILSQLISSSKR